MRRKLFLITAFLLLATFLVWRGRRPRESAPTATTSSVSSAKLTPPAEPASPNIAPAGTAAASGDVAASTPPMSPDEIARVVGDNSVPGRIVFVDLAFSATGITAVHATGAGGRAKPAAVQHGLGQLQYEVFSPAGERTFTGSVEDPLHRRLEYEDEQQLGKLRATVVDQNEGLLHLRLPGEADAARIVFYRETVSTSSTESNRESAGEVLLR